MFAGLNGAVAVALAAFASHSPIIAGNSYLLSVFAKANTMHFYHILALLFSATFYHLTANRWWLLSGILFALGIGLFCSTLYLFAFSGAKIAGFLTPVGGSCFIFAWLIVILAAYRGLSRDS